MSKTDDDANEGKRLVAFYMDDGGKRGAHQPYLELDNEFRNRIRTVRSAATNH